MILSVICVLCQAVVSLGLPVQDATLVSPGPICLDPECVIDSGVILSALDQTADPCQDFYRYACGGWMDKAQIPPWDSSISKSFGGLYHANLKTVKTILEADSPMYSALQKARDYYAACMDLQGMEKAGAQPLLKLIEVIGGWSLLPSLKLEFTTNNPQFLTTLIAVQKITGSPLFDMGVTIDDKNSSRHIIEFVQSGLWLGARELYLGGHDDLLAAYVKFGVTLASLLAWDKGLSIAGDFLVQTERKMKEILAFEIELAKISVSMAELRNPWKTYHKMTLSEFAQLVPDVDVQSYVNGVFGREIPMDEEVLVPTLSYFPKMNELTKRTPQRTIHDYVVWNLVASLSGSLSQAYREAVLEFTSAFTGTMTVAPRWMTCAGSANQVLGFATGAEFVRKRHSLEIKDKIKAIVENVRKTFIDRLPSVDWMDNTTKSLAVQKAQAIQEKLVAPSWLEDTNRIDDYYSKLMVNSKSFFNNILSAGKFYSEKNLAKYGEPVDRMEWDMVPAEVNAYYTSSMNEIVFPAGILQFPFYSSALPSSINYGSIGWVIGHELTHGFDDRGRNYDDVGNLHNWWKNASAQAYKERAQCVLEQYSSFKIGDKHVNGLLTLGENIADNGGLRLALQAYHSYRELKGGKETRLPGLQDMTPEQIFFIGAGQTWCKLDTPQHAVLKLLSDPHSPGKYRVIGTFSNTEEFSEAFKCPKGSVMNPEKKCHIW
ncbi:endothelin-converting enzyme 1-like [Acanthaster planci]|uniref:Endothelin-converting enzyme 1-like n=1 Tax=Acanthaster planci TaxID=133434 RepID=A0A8B7YDZ3_ACAPL|nr:endothelin-converting enzyme 1-like [Acanthaster planci]